MDQMTVKELEIQGCRTFVCPNLSLIEEKGKDLELRDTTIKRAKDMAIRYFKETYHMPHYSSVRHVLPAFIYIAAILEGEKRGQRDVAVAFGTTNVTIRKWYRYVIDTLKLEILCDEGGKLRISQTPDSDLHREFILPNLDPIDEGGKALILKDKTIETAKNLAVRYFKATYQNPRYSSERQLFPAFIYIASAIENDRRTQMDISTVFHVSESSISKWHIDVTRTLGMKIIYGDDRHVIAVLEREENI